jgi:hypothetical protein
VINPSQAAHIYAFAPFPPTFSRDETRKSIFESKARGYGYQNITISLRMSNEA